MLHFLLFTAQLLLAGLPVLCGNWNKFPGVDKGSLIEYDYGFANNSFVLGFGDVDGDRQLEAIVANTERKRVEILYFDKSKIRMVELE